MCVHVCIYMEGVLDCNEENLCIHVYIQQMYNVRVFMYIIIFHVHVHIFMMYILYTNQLACLFF